MPGAGHERESDRRPLLRGRVRRWIQRARRVPMHHPGPHRRPERRRGEGVKRSAIFRAGLSLQAYRRLLDLLHESGLSKAEKLELLERAGEFVQEEASIYQGKL